MYLLYFRKKQSIFSVLDMSRSNISDDSAVDDRSVVDDRTNSELAFSGNTSSEYRKVKLKYLI